MNALKSKAVLSLVLFAGIGSVFAAPTQSSAADRPAISAARVAPLTVKNYTTSTLKIYVNNSYSLRVPPFKSRTVYVPQKLNVYRAITSDGRSVARLHRMGPGGMVWRIRTKSSTAR